MNPTGPLNPGGDVGFRTSPGAAANGKSTIARSGSESFIATLDRIVGAPSKGPSVRRPRAAAGPESKPEKSEIERTPREENSDGAGKPADTALISDCPISPATPRVPESAPQSDSQHSGDDCQVDERMTTAAEACGTSA